MQDFKIFEIDEFPFAEFGSDIKRKVRLLQSPYTTGDGRLSIVHVSIPPKGISEGHVHDDCDEYIHFDHCGKVAIDGVDYDVRANSIVYAPRGRLHECSNTSGTDELHLFCIFVPPLKPYNGYFELIEKTKSYLKNK